MNKRQPITAVLIAPPKACVHLRGQNQHTQCGLPITPKLHVPGLPGFRLAHSIRRDSVCVTCLNKSANLKKPK